MLFRTRHLVLAFVLHVVVIGFLIVGVRCSRKVEPPPPIQAAIVDARPQPARPEPPKEDPNKKLEEERRKKEEQERQKQKEEDRRLEEQKRLEEAQREQARKAKEQERIQLEKKKKAEDEAKRKKAEAERKKKEEQERKQQEDRAREERRLTDLQRQLEAEETQRNQRYSDQARINAQQEWNLRIQEKVKRNWLRPPGVAEEFQCRVRIELLPSGDVVGQPQLLQSCGNPLLDDSVIKAILKSSPLPTPADPAVFERSINFNFIP